MTKAGNINISFWDLLIAETMKDARVSVLLTENIRDFSKVPWIKAINPMASVKSIIEKAV